MDQITKIDDSTYEVNVISTVQVKVSDLEHQIEQCDIDLHEFQIAVNAATEKMTTRQKDKDALLAQVQAASDAGLADAVSFLADIAAQAVTVDPLIP